MPICHASRNAMEIVLIVPLSPGGNSGRAEGRAKSADFKLSMSLKRHAYHYIDEGESKEENSVLHASVDVPGICTDAKNIGDQLMALVANNQYAILSDSWDFVTESKRKYRVDNHRGGDGFNHFYPIASSNRSENKDVYSCDMNKFERLRSFRRIAKDFDGADKSPFTNWAAFKRNDSEWKSFKKDLLLITGDEAILGRLESEGRSSKKASSSVSVSSSLSGIVFSNQFSQPNFDDDPSSSSGYSSGGASDDDGDDPFW